MYCGVLGKCGEDCSSSYSLWGKGSRGKGQCGETGQGARAVGARAVGARGTGSGVEQGKGQGEWSETMNYELAGGEVATKKKLLYCLNQNGCGLYLCNGVANSYFETDFGEHLSQGFSASTFIR